MEVSTQPEAGSYDYSLVGAHISARIACCYVIRSLYSAKMYFYSRRGDFGP